MQKIPYNILVLMVILKSSPWSKDLREVKELKADKSPRKRENSPKNNNVRESRDKDDYFDKNYDRQLSTIKYSIVNKKFII